MKGLSEFLQSAREAGFDHVPSVVTPENVNQPLIFLSESIITLLGYAVDGGTSDVNVVRSLIELKANITIKEMDWCRGTRFFHMLLHYGGDPNVCDEHGYQMWRCYTLCYESKLCLFEYGATIPPELEFSSRDYIYSRDMLGVIQNRVDNCRRALLTLIWIAPPGLKSLFISWSKWIWNMKPYVETRQICIGPESPFYPSIGPRSPIWDLKESQDLSHTKK
jgi:hypothetical protein